MWWNPCLWPQKDSMLSVYSRRNWICFIYTDTKRRHYVESQVRNTWRGGWGNKQMPDHKGSPELCFRGWAPFHRAWESLVIRGIFWSPLRSPLFYLWLRGQLHETLLGRNSCAILRTGLGFRLSSHTAYSKMVTNNSFLNNIADMRRWHVRVLLPCFADGLQI